MVVVEVVAEEVEVGEEVAVLAPDMVLDMDQEKDLDMVAQAEDMVKEVAVVEVMEEEAV